MSSIKNIIQQVYRYLNVIILVVVMSLSCFSTLQATIGAEFLRQDSSPNASILMGGAALEQGRGIVVVNPAGLLEEKDISLSFTHFASFVETAYEQLDLVYPINQGLAIGGRLFYSSTYNLVEINEYGESVGSVDNYDVIIHPALAIGLGKHGNLGFGLKLFQSVLAGYSSIGAALDIGGQYELPDLPIGFGLSVQNLGLMTAYDEQADQLPITASIGTAVKWKMVHHQLTLLADLATVFEDVPIVAPVIGLQYQYQKNAFFKAAYRIDDELGNLMIGAGLHWGLIGLDYSYQPYGELGDNHRLTLSYFFRELTNDQPKIVKRITGKQAQRLQAKPIPNTTVPVLNIMPRTYSAKVSIMPIWKKAIVKQWSIRIVDEEQKVVRQFSGKNLLPKIIKWDGANKEGRLVNQASDLWLRLIINNKVIGTYHLPKSKSAVKLIAPKNKNMKVPVQFSFDKPKRVKKWELLIIEATHNSPQARYTGKTKLPKQLQWWTASKDSPKRQYVSQLKVSYSSTMKLVVKEPIKTIEAEAVLAPDDYQGIKIKGILFDFDRAELKPEMGDKLQAIMQLIRAYPQLVYTICEGHADAVGSEQYNQDLSEKRAHMVANKLLKDSGVGNRFVSMVGYGKMKPVSKDKLPAGQSKNRRVEIITFIPEDRSK